jgi:putative tryptophan/tyrosine transport system substrate-binding protein
VRRRDLVGALGSVGILLPCVRGASAAQKQLPKVGILAFGVQLSTPYQVFLTALRSLGWVEGQNVLIAIRTGENVEQLAEGAAELVAARVDVIFVGSSTHVEAARRATSTTPIVFAAHADPVGVGHVRSLHRPGGNITGLSQLLTELAVKQLELLTEAVPTSRKLGILWNPSTPSHTPALDALGAAAEKLGVSLVLAPTRSASDIEGAFEAVVKQQVGGLLVLASPLSFRERTEFGRRAILHRLPTVFGTRENVVAGGLLSYGADNNDLFRRAAVYVDRILNGAKPADLPVEQASKYEFVINLGTARNLDLTIPPTLLARADEVIE